MLVDAFDYVTFVVVVIWRWLTPEKEKEIPHLELGDLMQAQRLLSNNCVIVDVFNAAVFW